MNIYVYHKPVYLERKPMEKHVFQYCKSSHALLYNLIREEKFMIKIVWPFTEWHLSLCE